jgi:probable HAF family extracellular repeat protein
MRNRVAFFAVVLALGLSSSRTAMAQGYTYTTIDFPGAIESGAAGINGLGQIVGGYLAADGSRHGFLYSAGAFTTMDDPNNPTSSEATSINNSGQIVGSFTLDAPEGGHEFEGAHAFLFSGGTFTTLDYPAVGVDHTTATKINSSGTIAGTYRVQEAPSGFLDVGGIFSTVNAPVGLGCCTHDNGINDAGNIVGQYKFPDDSAPRQGFVDMGGVFTTLDYPGASDTFAEDINNLGDVVGFYSDLSGKNGYLYSGGAFSVIAYPGARQTQAVGINDQGDIVGFYQDSARVLHGFLATPMVTTIHVPIDIKPQGCPNPFNVAANGDLPVAILGTASFDVSKVDPSSVELQGVPALRSALEDVATPFNGPLVNAMSCTSAGPDGLTDLVLHFSDNAVAAALGAPTDGQVLVLTLTGKFLPQFGGTAIQGQDVVLIIKKK